MNRRSGGGDPRAGHCCWEPRPTGSPAPQHLTPTRFRDESLNEGCTWFPGLSALGPHLLSDGWGGEGRTRVAPGSLTHRGPGRTASVSKGSIPGWWPGWWQGWARPGAVIPSPSTCRLLSRGGGGAETPGGERRREGPLVVNPGHMQRLLLGPTESWVGLWGAGCQPLTCVPLP